MQRRLDDGIEPGEREAKLVQQAPAILAPAGREDADRVAHVAKTDPDLARAADPAVDERALSFGYDQVQMPEVSQHIGG